MVKSKQITAAQLRDELPPRRGLIPVPDYPDRGDCYVAEASAPPKYIVPNLVGQLSGARVVLLAAAAAVGKTALAQWLAASSESMLFDLSQANLGDNFVGGLTTSMFNIDHRSQIDARVRDGEVVLILDALDEALISPGGLAGLEAFSKSISRMEGVNSRRPICLVILGRIDAMEYCRAELQLLQVNHDYLELDYFDQLQSEQFVLDRLHDFADQKLAARLASSDHDLRTAFLHVTQSLGGLVAETQRGDPWDDRTGASFVGYAPVLASIASLLREESDWSSIPDSFSTAGLTGGLYQAIIEICELILVRERNKVESRLLQIADLAELLSTGAVDYSVETQLALLTSPKKVHERVEIPNGIPAKIGIEYREAIAPFIEAHPFFHVGCSERPELRERFLNSVFYDYVLAMLSIEPASNDIISTLGMARSGIGFMYGRLLVASSAEQETRIDGRAAPSMLSSLTQSRNADDAADVFIETSSASLAKISVIVEGAGEYATELTGTLSLPDNTLTIGGHVSRLRVLAPQSIVRIGPALTRFVAPVAISCDTLVVESHTPLEIGGAQGFDTYDNVSVALSAGKIHEKYGLAIEVSGGAVVDVYCDDPPFPWDSYVRGGSPRTTDSGRFEDALTELGSVSRWFKHLARRQNDGEFGVDADKFDLVVRKKKFNSVLVGHLIDTGTLHQRSGTYRLHLPDGVGFYDLVNGTLSDHDRSVLYTLLEPAI